MFPMTRSTWHPAGKYALFSSTDNSIVTYAATDRLHLNREKTFIGHNSAGYAIGVAVSPDGQIVSTGDTGRTIHFYDWKSTRLHSRLKMSDSAVVTWQWHPRETSKVVAGDMNGTIRYYD